MSDDRLAKEAHAPSKEAADVELAAAEDKHPASPASEAEDKHPASPASESSSAESESESEAEPEGVVVCMSGLEILMMCVRIEKKKKKRKREKKPAPPPARSAYWFFAESEFAAIKKAAPPEMTFIQLAQAAQQQWEKMSKAAKVEGGSAPFQTPIFCLTVCMCVRACALCRRNMSKWPKRTRSAFLVRRRR